MGIKDILEKECRERSYDSPEVPTYSDDDLEAMRIEDRG